MWNRKHRCMVVLGGGGESTPNAITYTHRRGWKAVGRGSGHPFEEISHRIIAAACAAALWRVRGSAGEGHRRAYAHTYTHTWKGVVYREHDHGQHAPTQQMCTHTQQQKVTGDTSVDDDPHNHSHNHTTHHGIRSGGGGCWVYRAAGLNCRSRRRRRRGGRGRGRGRRRGGGHRGHGGRWR